MIIPISSAVGALEDRGYEVFVNEYGLYKARHPDGTTVYGVTAEECLDTVKQDYSKQRRKK